jgi:hypothetical protein
MACDKKRKECFIGPCALSLSTVSAVNTLYLRALPAHKEVACEMRHTPGALRGLGLLGQLPDEN